MSQEIRKFEFALLFDGKGGASELNTAAVDQWSESDGETRPRAVVASSGDAIIMGGIYMNPGAVPDDMFAVRIWIEKDRIIPSLLTFVTGLLGMNVAGLSGIESPNGFLLSAVIMAIFGVGLATYFKWKRWI